MAIVMADRVKETTTTTGTGAVSLLGAATGFRTFITGIGATNQTYYVIEDGTNWETGVGTVNAGSPPTLSRNTLTASSTGAFINWGAGTRNVFCSYPATGLALTANNLSDMTASTVRANLGLGTAAVLNVGTSANNIVQLTAAGKYPAVDGSLITGLPASPIPAGTKMPFYQSSAPTGWTKVTGLTDKVFFITDTSPAGGTNDGGTAGWNVASDLTVQNHTLTIAEIPSHTHVVGLLSAAGTGGFNSFFAGDLTTPSTTQATGGGSGHSHGIVGSAAWRPPAVYFIICTKN